MLDKLWIVNIIKQEQKSIKSMVIALNIKKRTTKKAKAEKDH